MTLHVLGVSHRTASAQERAAYSLDPEQVVALLAHAAVAAPDLEVVILATCNRTEFYLAGADAVDRWRDLLADLCPAAAGQDDARWYLRHDEEAFRHLLRVASGLDSALLGDGQVLGQLRGALTAAQDAGTLGSVLSPCLATAIRTARRARAETDIGRGAPGVGTAVAEAVLSRSVPTCGEVVVVGSGEAGRTVVRALLKAGYTDVAVCNRTAAGASELAHEHQLDVVGWQDLGHRLSTAAVVVVATSAPQPVLHGTPARRTTGRLLVVDAGFPPQVASDVAGPQVDVVSLEALTGLADAAALARRAAVPEVEALVEAQVEAWTAEQHRLPLELAIKELHAEAARVTRAAARVLAGRPALSPDEVEGLLRQSVRELLHDHVTRLRSLHPRRPS